jgi:hypothetical protein
MVSADDYAPNPGVECKGVGKVSDAIYGIAIADVDRCKVLCTSMKTDCVGFNEANGKCTFWMESISGKVQHPEVNCYKKIVGSYDKHENKKCGGGSDLQAWKKTGDKDDCTEDDPDTPSTYNTLLDATTQSGGDLTQDTEENAEAQRKAELAACEKACDEHKDCAGFESSTFAQKNKPASKNKITRCSFWKIGDLKAGADEKNTICHVKLDKDRAPCMSAGSSSPTPTDSPTPTLSPTPNGAAGKMVDVTLNIPIPCPIQKPKEVYEKRTIDVPVPCPVTKYQDVPCPVPTPVQVPVPVTQTVHVRVPVPNVIDRPVPTPVTVQVQVPNPVPTPVPNPVPCPVPQTIQQKVPVPVYVDRVVDVPVPVPVPMPAPVALPSPCSVPAPVYMNAAPVATCGTPACGQADFGVAGVQVAGPPMPSFSM